MSLIKKENSPKFSLVYSIQYFILPVELFSSATWELYQMTWGWHTFQVFVLLFLSCFQNVGDVFAISAEKEITLKREIRNNWHLQNIRFLPTNQTWQWWSPFPPFMLFFFHFTIKYFWIEVYRHKESLLL